VDETESLFSRVRREPDALRQAKMAGELITIYQQRSVELARLRKEAINRAAEAPGMNFSAVAAALGLTRGRIAQIRQSAPPPERAFFGVGPVTVAVPLRSVPGRKLPMISMEDTRARDMLADLLGDLTFQVERFGIPPDGLWTPPRGDVVAICGPKSSPVTAEAITSDPNLTFEPDAEGTWTIRERDGSRVYGSPLDDATSEGWADVAYFGRLALGDRTILVIAGVHALGSVGVAAYIAGNLPDLYATVGTKRFSMVIASRHDGETVLDTKAICPPRTHE
jgi:hypothetical protein